MASGIVSALRQQCPKAHIAWLVEPIAADLLSENADIDEVIIWPKSQWKLLWRQRKLMHLWRSFRQFSKALRGAKFDVVVDLQGLMKSGIWARLSGAKLRYGLGSKEGSQHLMNHQVERPANDPVMCSEYIAMSQALGAKPQNFRMTLPVNSKTVQRVDTLLGEIGVSATHGFVVFCMYTTRPQKHWFDEHWAELIALAEKSKMNVLLLGGPGDAELCEQFLQRYPAVHAVNVCGKTRLLEAAEIIRRARLLVGVDTGLTHMGIAQNTPTLALFGSTRPYTETPSACAKVLYHDMPCAPCRRRPTCEGAFTCMKELYPQRVWSEAEALIAKVAAV